MRDYRDQQAMRFYKIVTPGQTWDATGDSSALNVELDIPVSPGHLTVGAFVRIWGIDRQTLLNARVFNRQSIQVFGGMQKGLPLANPNQQGLLVQGSIFPALGNWVGTDQTLDLYIVADLDRRADDAIQNGDARRYNPNSASHHAKNAGVIDAGWRNGRTAKSKHEPDSGNIPRDATTPHR